MCIRDRNYTGSGYRLGYFDEDLHFVTLGHTPETQISMVKTQNVSLSNGNYVDGTEMCIRDSLIVVLIGITFYLGLSHFDLVREKLDMFLSVVAPFIVGFAVAYLLNTPAKFLERELFAHCRHRRTWSIISVYLLAVLDVYKRQGLCEPGRPETRKGAPALPAGPQGKNLH